MEKILLGGVLLGFSEGAFDVSDEWNKLLPEYKFTGAEEFLTDAWRGNIVSLQIVYRFRPSPRCTIK